MTDNTYTGWVCPQCGHALKPVTYYGGAMALNRDQWESVRAGDWYCEKCKSDVSRSGYKYYWNHELQASSPATVQPPPQPEPLYPCNRCGKMRTKAQGGTTFTVCDECWEATKPQPANAAGEKWRHFAADALSDDSFAAYWKALDADTRKGLLAVMQPQCPRCAELERERDEAVEVCRTLVKNVEQPELEGASTLVLYFPNDADREELIEAFKQAKPNCKTIKL